MKRRFKVLCFVGAFVMLCGVILPCMVCLGNLNFQPKFQSAAFQNEQPDFCGKPHEDQTDVSKFSVVDQVVSGQEEKLDYDMSRVLWTKTRFTYDGQEHTVTLSGLPDDVTAVYEGNSATNAGTYTATVTFLYDEETHNAPVFENSTLTWTIAKDVINVSSLAWSQTSFEYDGQEHIVTLNGLPDGVEVEYEGNVATEVGTYYAYATLVYDSQNYELTEDPDSIYVAWTITSQSGDSSALTTGLIFALFIVAIIVVINLVRNLRSRRK